MFLNTETTIDASSTIIFYVDKFLKHQFYTVKISIESYKNVMNRISYPKTLQM